MCARQLLLPVATPRAPHVGVGVWRALPQGLRRAAALALRRRGGGGEPPRLGRLAAEQRARGFASGLLLHHPEQAHKPPLSLFEYIPSCSVVFVRYSALSHSFVVRRVPSFVCRISSLFVAFLRHYFVTTSSLVAFFRCSSYSLVNACIGSSLEEGTPSIFEKLPRGVMIGVMIRG